MKHGIKLRKLQRTPSHRWALLRNLVSALLHHEAIKTTLPKAKEAARMAEKMITLGKKGTNSSQRGAMAFLMPSHSYSAEAFKSPQPPPLPTGYPSIPQSASSAASSSKLADDSSTTDGDALTIDPETFKPPTTLLPKLFTTLAERYEARQGGYTRIHKFGRRQGDNAPVAILELVDGPKDLRFEMTARAVGRERAQAEWGVTAPRPLSPSRIVNAASYRGGRWSKDVVDGEGLRPKTKMKMDKVLKFRDEDDKVRFETIAKSWSNRLAVEETVNGGHFTHESGSSLSSSYDGGEGSKSTGGEKTDKDGKKKERRIIGKPDTPGERLAGMPIGFGALSLARGALGKLGRATDYRGRPQPDRAPRFLSERRTLAQQSSQPEVPATAASTTEASL